MKKLLSTLLALLFAAGIFAQNQNDGQKNGSQNQSVVYFTRNVSSAGLLKVYRALNQKIEGNVGIKVSFGGPDEEVLQPELLRELVRTTGGTMFDGNGFTCSRLLTETSKIFRSALPTEAESALFIQVARTKAIITVLLPTFLKKALQMPQKPRLTTRKIGRSSTFLTTSSRTTAAGARKISEKSELSPRTTSWPLSNALWTL